MNYKVSVSSKNLTKKGPTFYTLKNVNEFYLQGFMDALKKCNPSKIVEYNEIEADENYLKEAEDLRKKLD